MQVRRVVGAASETMRAILDLADPLPSASLTLQITHYPLHITDHFKENFKPWVDLGDPLPSVGSTVQP